MTLLLSGVDIILLPLPAEEPMTSNMGLSLSAEKISTSANVAPPTAAGTSASTNMALEEKSVAGKLFPFNNTSHPDGIHNDVLPYSVVNVERKGGNKKAEKFFILTSEQVLASKSHAAKEKQKKEEEKAKRQEEKAQRIKMKEAKQKEKEEQAAKRGNRKAVSKKRKEPSTNTHEENENVEVRESAAVHELAAVGSGVSKSTVEYYCLYCNEKYEEPITEDWIMCRKCEKWSHDKCSPACRKKRGKFICNNCV